jgi:hypothetical protein
MKLFNKEKIMFNKTLIHTAVAAGSMAMSVGAFAVSLSLDPDTAALDSTNSNPDTAIAPIHTVEGLTGATAMLATSAAIGLTSVLAVGDVLTVTYTQPFKVGQTAAATLVSAMDGVGADAVDNMTLSRNGSAAVAGLTEISYTVTDIEYDAGGTTDNSTVGTFVYTDPGLQFVPCTVACTVKVNASVKRAAAVVDPAATTSLTIGSAVAQMAVSATASFDGVVNVNTLRKSFVVGGTSDAGELTYAATSKTDGKKMAYATLSQAASSTTVVGAGIALTGSEATETKYSVTLNGDFGFLDLNAATAGIQLTATGKSANVLAASNFVATLTDPNALVFVDANASETVFGPSFTSNNKAVIPVQTVSGDFQMDYTSATSDAGSFTKTVAMGGLTMNGASTSYYAVPYGPGVSQLLWVSNEGSTAGDLTATAFDALGNKYPATGEYALGSIAGSSSLAIASTVKALMIADGLDETISNRVQLTVTATAPAANINFYGAYRVGDNRIALETSAQKDRLKLNQTAVAANATAIATVDTEVGVIDGLVDAEVIKTAAIDALIDAEVIKTAAILVDTGTTIPGTITTLDAVADSACNNALTSAAGLAGIAANGIATIAVSNYIDGSMGKAAATGAAWAKANAGASGVALEMTGC